MTSGTAYVHGWTSQHRQILRILKAGFGISWPQIVAILNAHVFSDMTKSKKITEGKVKAQWDSMGRHPSKMSQNSLRESFPSAAEEEQLRGHLQDIASRIGICLSLESYKSLASNGSIKGRKRARNLSDDMDTNNQMQWDFSNIQTPKPFSLLPLTPPTTLRPDRVHSRFIAEPQSPSLQVKAAKRSSANTNHLLPISTNQSAQKPDLTKLAFRGFSEKSQGLNGDPVHGFRAGRFIDVARIPPCPATGSEAFVLEATLHVAWSRVPTPFISCTTSPIRAMMKARSPTSGRYLAVIDLEYLATVTPVFVASELGLRPKRDDGTIIPYQPGGEYLVWGQIPTGRAIISIVQIENFLDPLPSHIDDVDPLCLGFITTAWKRVAVRSELSKKRLEKTYNSGLAFGRMVKAFNIPDYLTSDIVSICLLDWSLEKKLNDDWRNNTSFCQGLNVGLEWQLAQGSLSDDQNERESANQVDDFVDLLQELQVAAHDSGERRPSATGANNTLDVNMSDDYVYVIDEDVQLEAAPFKIPMMSKILKQPQVEYPFGWTGM